MEHLPRGTVTFLFTDIESSTRLWNEHPDAMRVAYDRHDAILRGAITAHEGAVYKTIGDAFQAVFPTAMHAVMAAVEGQRALQSERWSMPEPLLVRMALHTGAVDPGDDGDYRSPVLNRLGRLLGATHGGQVVVSQATMELARDHLPPGASLLDLGEQRLKDLYRPERVFQLAGTGLDNTFPPLRTLDARPNNLSTQPTQLIGRQDSCAVVLALLRRDDVRLITLTGPGGIGKTRLSLQVGADSLDAFRDGVFVAQLDALTDPSLVPGAIAQVFDMHEDSATSIRAALVAFLRAKEMLLILDNMEQVIDSADFVAELVAHCPRLKLLVTSRIRLQLRGEHEYPVPPLALPDPQHTPTLQALSQYESVRLFIDRAEAVKPSFEITSGNAPAVVEICTRLDGLPLAIELAAARIRLLPPEALLKRLSARLPFLTGGARDLPVRQQTLRGAIAWSHELLGPDDQMLFRRLAVFAGGASLDAIEAIATDTSQEWLALDGLERLVDQSLVRQEDHGGEPRFSMFETIREYGLEQLEAHNEAFAMHTRHATWYTEFASTFEWEASISAQVTWLDRMEAEHDNIRAALSWAIEHDPATAFRLYGFAGRYWQLRGHSSEGKAWTFRTIAVDRPDIPAEDRARGLRTGLIFNNNPDGNRLQWAKEVEGLYRELGDWRQVCLVVSMQAFILEDDGDEAGAMALTHEAIELARSIRDAFSTTWVLNNAANSALLEGQIERARNWIDEAVVLTRRQPSLYSFTVLATAAEVRAAQGEFVEAEALFRECLIGVWAGRLVALASGMLMGLVTVAAARAAWERAARFAGVEASLRHATDYSSDPDIAGIADDYERALAQTKAALGREAFDAAWTFGTTQRVEDIIAELAPSVRAEPAVQDCR